VQAWRVSSLPIEQRVEEIRPLALQLGVTNFDPAARALLLDASAGSALERAQAAVRLAPDLPAAQASLAWALLTQDSDPVGSLQAAFRSVRALSRHLEASLWLAATSFTLLSWVLMGAGFLFIASAALLSLRTANHDLGDLLDRSMPGFARAALVSALLLLPAALGEGLLGWAVGLFAIAFCYADSSRRLALGSAAILLITGLYPAAELAGRALAALGSDAVAEAAYATERGLASSLDLQRLHRVEGTDSLATRALALHAKRAGDLQAADARYRRLIGTTPDPLVLNNAANVRLELHDIDGAIDFYERAVEDLSSAAPIWFNLAQAYGRSIRVEDHAAALAEAQSLDPEFVRELTGILTYAGSGYVADLAIPAAPLRMRLLETPRPEAAARLRAPFAPGRLGADLPTSAAAFGLLAILSFLVRLRFEPSQHCSECGKNNCPRCLSRPPRKALCEGCARLLHRPETVDPMLCAVRLESLRRRSERIRLLRRAAALLVPGFAGLLAGRPVLSLLGLLVFLGAVAGVFGSEGVVCDPLSVGQAGPLALLLFAATCGLFYVVITSFAILFRRA
jgi:tetratricopeptide (TPR) repeat protein